ncbi:MAG: hypothetical protein EOO38_21770 [Cytophagaceae bacterium]|nr:MAG: hypothetical protein EOO38_21770 [Cytophagaceae bacterium]
MIGSDLAQGEAQLTHCTKVRSLLPLAGLGEMKLWKKNNFVSLFFFFDLFQRIIDWWKLLGRSDGHKVLLFSLHTCVRISFLFSFV